MQLDMDELRSKCEAAVHIVAEALCGTVACHATAFSVNAGHVPQSEQSALAVKQSAVCNCAALCSAVPLCVVWCGVVRCGAAVLSNVVE